MSAQEFKDSRMEPMIGRKSMPNARPVRDPRRDGLKDPGNSGEHQTRMANRLQGHGHDGVAGPRSGGYQQAAGPGLLNDDNSFRSPAAANARIHKRGIQM